MWILAHRYMQMDSGAHSFIVVTGKESDLGMTQQKNCFIVVLFRIYLFHIYILT